MFQNTMLEHQPSWLGVTRNRQSREQTLLIWMVWPSHDTWRGDRSGVTTCNLRRRISFLVCYWSSNEEELLAEMMVFKVMPPNCCILCIINTSLLFCYSKVSNVRITWVHFSLLLLLSGCSCMQPTLNYLQVRRVCGTVVQECGMYESFCYDLRQLCQEFDLFLRRKESIHLKPV